MKTNHSFYLQDNVCEIAKALCGKILATNVNGTIVKGKIVETEAYSEVEQACHAYGGKRTKRTKTLFERGGVAYVYLIYGMYHLVNVVTNRKGVGEAVLIRAIEPLVNIEVMAERRKITPTSQGLTSGPGKLSQAFGIDRSLNGVSLMGDTLWIEDGIDSIPVEAIISTTRIGVDYAGEDAELPWRYYIRDNYWVSKK